MDVTTPFADLDTAAERLGVPTRVLRREVREGRVPFLKRGSLLIIDVQAAERALREAMQVPAKGGADVAPH